MPTSTASLGLEKIRRRQGVSLEDIADSTKISKTFLKAIESEDFGKLPGGVFDRSYLRQYAAAISIDDSRLLSRYATYEAEREREEAPPAAPPRRNAAIRWLASLVASVLATVAPHS